jgi:hypothetical protein
MPHIAPASLLQVRVFLPFPVDSHYREVHKFGLISIKEGVGI